jgi:hypothetical protein
MGIRRDYDGVIDAQKSSSGSDLPTVKLRELSIEFCTVVEACVRSASPPTEQGGTQLWLSIPGTVANSDMASTDEKIMRFVRYLMRRIRSQCPTVYSDRL